MALKRKIKKRRGRREGEEETSGGGRDPPFERRKIKICPRRYIIRPTTFVRPRNLHVKRGPAASNLWFFFLITVSLSLSLGLFFLSIHPALKDEKFTTSATTSFSLVFSREIPWFRPFSTFFPRISSFLFSSTSLSILDRARKTSLQGVNARKKLARSQLLSSTLVSQGLSVE